MAGSSLPSPTASFDQDCKYVTSYLFSSRILAGLRLALGTYSLVSNIVILVWAGVVLHDAQVYVVALTLCSCRLTFRIGTSPTLPTFVT
jgi:hypothetical protein